MLRDRLIAKADPVLREVLGHPFWAGLRSGSLPGESLTHFVEQDTGHLLPAYGRALARCAATAADDAHAVFFARAAVGTLQARDRLRDAFTELAPELDLRAPAADAPADPLTLAHCSFFQAAAATSPAAGIGALLPMAWFNHQVSADLARRCAPGSRYAPWALLYQPAEGYSHVVERCMGVAEETAQRGSEHDRAQLTDFFSMGVRYEWTFAESAWARPDWPVRP
ncbi:TenA family transcriptional regulator [Streptomyces sp. TM32]|uniref:TenA family protein n=1 Tax=Streptomyces sp. TM32 TaxID=1652669 RepID=UPI0010127A81|nr:TenA family transcriptional regulator [Streptomyces sp. TM32]RXS72690.1 TenA family transcriptional regulator [Streptomyces sp. TM32]